MCSIIEYKACNSGLFCWRDGKLLDERRERKHKVKLNKGLKIE